MPPAPSPGRMYSEMLGKMKASDGSRMMFREFYERTCDEADADGGPGGSTTVCPLMVAYTVMRYHQGAGAGTWRRCQHGKGCSQNLMCGGLAPDIGKVVTKEMAQRLQHTYEINRDVSLRAAQARIKKAEEVRRELLGGPGVRRGPEGSGGVRRGPEESEGSGAAVFERSSFSTIVEPPAPRAPLGPLSDTYRTPIGPLGSPDPPGSEGSEVIRPDPLGFRPRTLSTRAYGARGSEIRSWRDQD